MRRCRISLPNRCYHLISRVAHRAYFLDEDERTRLVDFVRRVAEFSGVKLLAYSVMSNHFHVFVYIGRPEPLSDAEIVRRISALYSDVRFERVMKKWNELAKRPDSPSFRRYRASFLRRMWNASEFMKTLKQRYTMSFNGRRDHHGTMWESRYRVRVKDPAECGMMLAESGYVDANPVNAAKSPQQKYALTKDGRRRIERVAPL
jgi:REP element-mobilizing transposase RayT